MVHGSTDKETTWCGKQVLQSLTVPLTLRLLSWSPIHWEVTCVPCLHAALNQSCSRCKVRKRIEKEAK